MWKTITLTIFILAALLPGKDEKSEFLFRYIFSGQQPEAGYADIVPGRPPILPHKSIMLSKDGPLVFNGKNDTLSIPQSAHMPLPNSAWLAIVKFYDNGDKAGQPDSCDALLLRRGQFLTGRNRWQDFYSNYCEARASGPLIEPNRFLLLEAVYSPVENNKITTFLYINGRRVNWPVPKEVDLCDSSDNLEFGSGYPGTIWHFHGELAELAMFKSALLPAELSEFNEQLLYGKEKLPNRRNPTLGISLIGSSTIKIVKNRFGQNWAFQLVNGSRALYKIKSDDWENYLVEFQFKISEKPSLPEVELAVLQVAARRFSLVLRFTDTPVAELREGNKVAGVFPIYNFFLPEGKHINENVLWHHVALQCHESVLKLVFNGFAATGTGFKVSGRLEQLELAGNCSVDFSDLGVFSTARTPGALRRLYVSRCRRDGILHIPETSHLLEKLIKKRQTCQTK